VYPLLSGLSGTRIEQQVCVLAQLGVPEMLAFLNWTHKKSPYQQDIAG